MTNENQTLTSSDAGADDVETRTETRTVTLPDGRALTFDLRGPAGGRVVVFLTVAPGSRRFDPAPAATAAAGVRLVTVDRPGYGASDPYPAGAVPTLDGMAADVAHGLEQLGLLDAPGGVALAGWSAGGRVALSLAARLGDAVRSVALLAAPASDDDVPWIPEGYREVLHELRGHPEDAYGALAAMLGGAPRPEGAAATELVAAGAADEALVARDGALRDRLTSMLEEAFRGGAAGMAADLTAANVPPSGFDPAAVRAPVHLWYGEDDPLVTPAHGEHFAATLPRAGLVVVPGAGHLVVTTEWAQALATLTG
jgi:pimeloyl-ACP methyl ester carboxylesterase